MRVDQAARLTLWCNAIASGSVHPDGFNHQWGLVRVQDARSGDSVSVSVAMAERRAQVGARVRLVLPVSGDTGGVTLPPAAGQRALTAGAALILEPVSARPSDHPQAWIPRVDVRSGIWLDPFDLSSPLSGQLDVSTCSRQLLDAMAEAETLLEALDVGSGRDRIDESLRDRALRPIPPPPGADARAQSLLERGLAVLLAVEVGQAHPARAWSASQQRIRGEALRELSRAARRAVETAVGPEWAGQPGPLPRPLA